MEVETKERKFAVTSVIFLCDLIFNPLLQMLKVTATKNKTKIGDWEGVITQGCVKDVCVSQNG